MLFGPQNDPIITVQYWSILRSLWPAIVLSKPSEKLSVIRLKEDVVDTVSKCFVTPTIELEVPDSCLTAARALWDHFPRPALPQPSEDEIQEGVRNLKQLGEFNLAAYNGLLDELLRCILEESLHWRHRLMAMSFIRDLVHPDQIYPAKIVRYFLQALVHDSLEERKIAIKIVVFMLRQQKREHPKVQIRHLYKHFLSEISLGMHCPENNVPKFEKYGNFLKSNNIEIRISGQSPEIQFHRILELSRTAECISIYSFEYNSVTK